MNDELAIKVDSVSKSFRLPHEKSGSLKGALVGWRNRKRGYEDQRVLKDISFEIKKGEFFGVVGRNGSGKSTLLKLISQIYSPDKGSITVNGKLTPFIELGVGFNPELSGRDNVYLNGALLGFSRSEMERMYDEIVEFAELERFMDQKLKNYSSGMQVRLAFSVAIKAKSDILVLDEVLAVGDEAFQRKCIAVFEQYKARKQTIILVTHDMSTVERFCDRAMLLGQGEIELIGSSNKVASKYSENNLTSYIAGKKEVRVDTVGIGIRLTNERGKKSGKFSYGDTAKVELTWSHGSVKHAGVAIYKLSGEYVFGPNTAKENIQLDLSAKKLTYSVSLDVGPGEYYIKAGLFDESGKHVLEFVEDGPSFVVEWNEKKTIEWEGITYLDHSWSRE